MSDSRPSEQSLAEIRKLALDFGPHPLARALGLVLEDLTRALDMRDQARAASARDLEARRAADKKWQDYENDYILPCFQWAKESGIDLEDLVRANPGRNCVALLVSALKLQRDNLRCVVEGAS